MYNNSISTLFSNLGKDNHYNIYNNMSELASIKTGSYRKLVQNYYGNSETKNDDNINKINKNDIINKIDSLKSTTASKEKVKSLTETRSKAEDLKKSADALRKNDDKSVFKQTDGKYNTDDIYTTVNGFIKNYNTVIEDANKSDVNSIKNVADSMINSTKANSKILSKIGITIGDDNKLSINEDTFKKADMNTVKSIFGDTGSYGYQTSVRSTMIDYAAKNEAQKASTYNNTGNYAYNLDVGMLFNQNI